MSLRWYRRQRLVVLNPNTPILDAARAMENNDIGALLVQRDGAIVGIVTDRDLAVRALGHGLDPKSTPLSQVMTENVATLSPSNDRSDAVELMRNLGVRRIPLVEKGVLAGIVTLDDLLLDETVSLDDLSEVLESQLGEGGPAPSPRTPAAQRSAARAGATYRAFMGHLQEATELESFEITETAVEVVLTCLLRRLTAGEAGDLVAQLPSLLQPKLQHALTGPDTSINAETVVNELVQRLDVDPERAAQLLEVIGFETLVGVSEGQAEEVQQQLPQDLREAILAPQ